MKHAEALPSELSFMHLYPINGKVHNLDPGETAFAYRGSTWSQVIAGVDPDPEKFDSLRRWARNYWEEISPYAADGGYLNFMMEEDEEVVRNMYGINYNRLRKIKKKYDPENFFHINQNVVPA
jgi:hypothetical protein